MRRPGYGVICAPEAAQGHRVSCYCCRPLAARSALPSMTRSTVSRKSASTRHGRDVDHARFAIGFDERDRLRVHELWESVFDSAQWSEGDMTQRFEAAWGAWNDLPAVAFSSWAGGAMAALEFAGVSGKTVLCPSNTFMATPLSVVKAGAEPVFVDCNREDLCMSFTDFEEKATEHKPKAAWLVHVGGHLAFDSARIAAYCREHDIFLLEDCAHAHGAHWKGRKPGGFGDVGVYSFYATKTISTGEGGVLVSRHPDLIEYARLYRNYGKPDHAVEGLNYRMSEFTAALGIVQTERLEEIVAWKNEVARTHLDPKYPNRVPLPEGMVSGYYKYIVFEPLERSTGKVYDRPCHRIMGFSVELPNTDWVAENHWCAPLYYRPDGRPEVAK
jgi:perosamine synthetase